MPETVARFTISLSPELLEVFDKVCAGKGYASRSEAVRDAIRDYLVAHQWSIEDEDAGVVGTITLVRDEAKPRTGEDPMQSDQYPEVQVLSSVRVPLDRPHWVEVVVVRGRARQVVALADALISGRDVKFGRLVSAADGAELL